MERRDKPYNERMVVLSGFHQHASLDLGAFYFVILNQGFLLEYFDGVQVAIGFALSKNYFGEDSFPYCSEKVELIHS